MFDYDKTDLPAALEAACRDGSFETAKAIYQDLMASNPSTKQNTLKQMAYLCADNNQAAILSFCFSEGLALNPKHVNDPIIYAALDSGSIEILKILLTEGHVSPNQYLEHYGSPLNYACQSGNLTLVNLLLEHGADPNNNYVSIFGDYQALIQTIVGAKPSLAILQVLLKNGAKVEGTGALIAAAERGDIKAAQVILEEAKQAGMLTTILEEVVEYGPEDLREDGEIGTPLEMAVKNKHEDVEELLRKYLADLEMKKARRRSGPDLRKEKSLPELIA